MLPATVHLDRPVTMEILQLMQILILRVRGDLTLRADGNII